MNHSIKANYSETEWVAGWSWVQKGWEPLFKPFTFFPNYADTHTHTKEWFRSSILVGEEEQEEVHVCDGRRDMWEAGWWWARRLLCLRVCTAVADLAAANTVSSTHTHINCHASPFFAFFLVYSWGGERRGAFPLHPVRWDIIRESLKKKTSKRAHTEDDSYCCCRCRCKNSLKRSLCATASSSSFPSSSSSSTTSQKWEKQKLTRGKNRSSARKKFFGSACPS